MPQFIPSPGPPRIISICHYYQRPTLLKSLGLPQPAAALCLLPIISKVLRRSSSADLSKSCQHHVFLTLASCTVTLSGLPASTVSSFTVLMSKSASSSLSSLSSCSGSSVVGVPPPKYTVSRSSAFHSVRNKSHFFDKCIKIQINFGPVSCK